MSNTDYYKTFKAIRAVVDVHGGRAGFHEAIFKEMMREIKKENGLAPGDPATDEIKEKALNVACDEYLGCLFVRNADDERHKDLKRTLDNANLFRKDDYPITIEDRLRMMNNHKPSQTGRTVRQAHGNIESSGVTFEQPGQSGQSSRQWDISNDKCFNCGCAGHHTKDCKKEQGAKTGTDFFNVDEEAAELEEELGNMGVQEGADFFNMLEGVGFIEVERKNRKTCDRNKAYLDTCCTNHSCFAAEHLENIHDTGVVLKQHCNAGTNTTGKAGFWRNIKFWYNEGGIANLISAPQLESDGYILEYVTTLGWLVHGPDGKTMIFKRDSGLCGGMPYVDLTQDPAKFIVDTNAIRRQDGMIMVQTVRGNYEGYIREQVENAKKVRDEQAMMAHPSDDTLRHLVSSTNAVRNLDLSPPAIANAKKLLGPDL
eukprot:CCRYP_018547-RA/>CCRYP_018547-RA protein AED:0.32 eAED:0.32 QI:0/-1/0/1/-1/1/1/0/427